MSKRKLPPLTKDEIGKLIACGYTEDEIKARDDLNIATVAYYRELGYLPEALVNYLGRLGWSLDDKTEFIPLDQMIANFGLERVNDSPGNFDGQKLYWLQSEYMKLLPLAKKLEGALPFLKRAKLVSDPVDDPTRQRLSQIIEAAGDRVKLFSDVIGFAAPFLKPDPDYDPKAVEKRLKPPGASELLRGFAKELQTIEPFDPPTLDKALHSYCESNQKKPADLVHPVRVAITGNQVGFGLFDTLAILGREESLRRIDKALTL
jgi:glutamyl-tRNA synthetase